MERRFVFTLVLAVCAAPAAAGKDPVRNAREATVDNRQIGRASCRERVLYTV